MSRAHGNPDKLRLAANSTVVKMIAKKGTEDENVVFSAIVEKVNRRDKHQSRALLITSRALYNLAPDNFKCKRRMPLEDIDSLIISTTSDEMIVHMPNENEYDYKLISEAKDQIALVLADVIDKYQGRKLKVTRVKDKSIPFTGKDKSQSTPTQGDNKENNEDDEDDGDSMMPESKEKVSLKDFELLHLLGKGAFGKVVKVKKRGTENIFAMKILKKKFIYENQQIEHTLVERAILSAFDNPFIMTLRYAFQTKDKLFLVMDFYQGGELYHHLEKKQRFSEEEARFIIAEIACAIGHLHSLDFIYRDLKPENILVDTEGHVCLTDFGLAKRVEPDEPLATTFVGTPQYIAPEIVNQQPHGKSVDWWSLGILLYELVVGVPPFHSDNMNELFQKIIKAPLRFPPPEMIPMSIELKHLISRVCQWLLCTINIFSQLLIRDPAERLGTGEGDIEDIIRHPFFATIDWDKLFAKEIIPPYQPAMSSKEKDVEHIPHSLAETMTFNVSSNNTMANLPNFTFVGKDNKLT
eukprot:TRINITY_DN26_c0_g2_i4.p1 TRINITY_DN26_c0_g2~~TRINITY_DN26_c0_g2_i4.p1  ORF type:complete len:524 (-),score=131.43 TRINITY_DN26_c0_g2_i4:73-1644(-)